MREGADGVEIRVHLSNNQRFSGSGEAIGEIVRECELCGYAWTDDTFLVLDSRLGLRVPLICCWNDDAGDLIAFGD